MREGSEPTGEGLKEKGASLAQAACGRVEGLGARSQVLPTWGVWDAGTLAVPGGHWDPVCSLIAPGSQMPVGRGIPWAWWGWRVASEAESPGGWVPGQRHKAAGQGLETALGCA